MKFQLIFEEETFLSFNESICYYEKKSLHLAEKFETEFWKTIEKIKENPFHFQIRYKNIRVAYTKVFSFGIHFIVDNEKIVVLDLFHTSQDY